MTMSLPDLHSRRRQRIRAVYGALAGPSRPASPQPTGVAHRFMLAEWAALAVFALMAAGIIALRAWAALS
ncbi:MAG: hypothetical protein Q8S58_01395 [Bosea sp. (in: a-proteobacteria)]|uniref:hypothetical protein n=1 Tax=Bosea sp. (in: a-proteobacteria) TaxID=1871050 RepID=UPI00273519FF|nr:hypothetical protein [Bosea sp. (in: a-proteobacteria)]MDP3257105.1 hypothetical protein [Bosea sp. (in: a-proteobacteria)]MDP3317758.1 hypothetical protein [Bosea sp. (in: a-proteobacteria)]